jgi:PAS domain S-box-containing protein
MTRRSLWLSRFLWLVAAVFPILAAAGWIFVSVPAALLVVVIVSLVLRTAWQAEWLSEKQIRLCEAKFSGILSISEDAIISIDENQVITLFNESARKIFGYSREEAIGAPLDILIPDRLRAIHRDQIVRFMTGEDSARQMGERDAVISGRRKNGEEFHAAAAISKAEVEGKKIMTVVLRDITEQKRVENEQRFIAEVGSIFTSTLNYEDTLRNIAQLLVRDLADFCILDAVEDDGAVRRLKAMSRDPSDEWVCHMFMQVPLDKTPTHLVRPVLQNHRTVFIDRLSPEMIGSVSQVEEELRVLLAAEIKSVIAVPLIAHGKLVGGITLLSCSPSRVYRSADVRLAEAIAPRAALAVLNARLFGEAQRATKTREDVLAIVSHDLKNPVATMALVGHLLRRFERLERDKLTEFADKIHRSVDKMQSLIADLLDFSSMQGGTFSVETKLGRLNPLVTPVVDSMKVLAEAKQQKLAVDLPPNLPEVMVDPHRISQVISNLLGNAIKFTPEGGTIRISAHQKGKAVVVSVSDTGPGIPREFLSKIFDRFWQVHGTKQAGTGLGLSIAKGIVDAHRGKIWAESQVGKGSSFCFTLLASESDIRRIDRAA